MKKRLRKKKGYIKGTRQYELRVRLEELRREFKKAVEDYKASNPF